MQSDGNPLQQAIERVETERLLVRQERCAWESCLDAVRCATVSKQQSTAGGESQRHGTGVQTLRRRYEETVMNAPNYDDEYGDTVDESLVAEFGPGLAEALSSVGPLRPQTRRNLLVRTGNRVKQTRRYAATLDAEREHLEETDERLAAIESRLTSVRPPTEPGLSKARRIEAWSTLEELEARCQRLLADRQQFLDEEIRPNIDGDLEEFSSYLYGDSGFRHPVLRAVADTVASIESRRTNHDCRAESP